MLRSKFGVLIPKCYHGNYVSGHFCLACKNHRVGIAKQIEEFNKHHPIVKPIYVTS